MRYSKTRYGHIKPERIKYLAERFKLSERFVKILLNRGLKTEAEIKKFLEPKIEDLHDPFLMKGMREAVYRTRLAIDRKERILVFGDFDADGIVATYILKQALLENGAKDVFHFLPHRVDDGYGLTEKTIEYSTKKFKPDLIITVDCGISAHKEVELIKAMGIDIIITDHHEIPETMPATHVVNTLQEGCKYPFKDLCGAGISFKLVEALFGRTYAKKFLAPLSIATIADIVSLTGENRVLVSLGLADAARFPKGIRALIKHLKIDRLTSSEIAFKVAPKINAPGRMGNAEPSIELFFEQDEKKIKALIEKIENLNVMRRERGQVVQEDAEREVKKHNLSTSRSIVLKNEKWEQGVLGIAASKLSNDFKRPTILFSKIDTVLKGSGRSINGIDMVEMLTDINKKGLILNFGGHEMAAGLSIREENFLEFKKEVELWLDRKELDQHYETKREFDEFITEEEITDAFVNELMLLEPTGQENRQPTFKLDFKQCEVSQLKKASPHISLKLQKGQRIISFNGVKYLNALNSKCSKQVLLEFGRENFRGKEGIKAEAKSFNFLYFEADEKLELGVKMLQYAMLFGNIPRKISKMSMFRKVEEKELGNVVDISRTFGNLFITYDTRTAVRMAGKTGLSMFKYELTDINGESAVLICPTNVEDFYNYRNIIFLEEPLDFSFLTTIVERTKANCYVVNVPSKVNQIVKSISFQRDVFKDVYSKIKLSEKSKNFYISILDFFEKEIGESISFLQFVFCLLVFVELGFISVINTDFNFECKVLKESRKELNESPLYEKLREIANGNN